MSQEFLDPNSNVNTLWVVYSYTGIDDGTRDPIVPGSDDAFADHNDNDEKQAWGMGNTTLEWGEVTSIVVKIYVLDFDADSAECNIRVGGVEETAQAVATGSNEWKTITFNGSWTKADVDALEVSLEPTGIGKGTVFEVWGLYAEINGILRPRINIGDAWKDVPAIKINIGDAWKDVAAIKINIGDAWKDVF